MFPMPREGGERPKSHPVATLRQFGAGERDGRECRRGVDNANRFDSRSD